MAEAGGKAFWEPTAEAREKSLQERKAQMILAARKWVLLIFYSRFVSEINMALSRRMLEQQAAKS